MGNYITVQVTKVPGAMKTITLETENKTVRFPVDLISRIEQIMIEKDVSFSGFVIQACEYVVDELENEK